MAEGVKEEVDLHFILGRPQETVLLAAYESAKEILKGARFATEVVDENDVDDLVSAMEDEYRTHLRHVSR